MYINQHLHIGLPTAILTEGRGQPWPFLTAEGSIFLNPAKMAEK